MGDPKTHKADKDAQKSHMGVRKTLRRHDVDAKVETLHRLLNYHLPGDLALPVGHAAGARDFGPLTEDRVKKFQRDKKINFGTERYMSGVVDDATWSALTKKKAAVVTIKPVPNGIGLSDWFDRKRPSFGLPPLNPRRRSHHLRISHRLLCLRRRLLRPRQKGSCLTASRHRSAARYSTAPRSRYRLLGEGQICARSSCRLGLTYSYSL
jgi:hypothetical protein